MTQPYGYGIMELCCDSELEDWTIGMRDRGWPMTEMKASKELIESWRADPAATVSVILHVDGPADRCAPKVSEHGLTVSRVFQLTDTVAANGPAKSVLSLLDEPWIRRVELDQEIRATG